MKKFLLVIILLALIAAGAIFAYQNFILTPEKIIKTSFLKMLEVKSYHQISNINLEGKIRGNDINAKAVMHSDSNLTDRTSPKFNGVLDISLSAEGLQFMLSSEITMISDNFYFRLTKLPSLFSKTKTPLDVNKYKDQWIKIPISKYKDINTKRSPEVINEIKNWIKENNIFSKIEKLKQEKIETIMCYHYMVTLNKEAIIDLVKRLDKYSDKKTSSENFNRLQDKLNQMHDINIELWISKKNKLFSKIKIDKLAIATTGDSDKLNISMDATYSKYNEMVSVQEPVNFINLEDLIKEFMNNFKPMPQNMPKMQIPKTRDQ